MARVRLWGLGVFALTALVLAPAATGEAQPASRLDAIVKAKKLRVGMAPNSVFVFKDPKTNQLEGFEVDAVRLLAKDLGVELELVEATWATLFAGLQADKYDMVASGSRRTLQRSLAVAFTNPYVSLTELAMVRRRDNIKTWADVDKKGATLCSVLGGATHLSLIRIKKEEPDVIKNASIAPLKEIALCGDAVASGQATAWLEEIVSITLYIKQHPEAGLQTLELPFASHGEGNGYAIAKGDQDFLNFLNIFITKMQNSGTYAKLAEKHGLPPAVLVKGWGQR